MAIEVETKKWGNSIGVVIPSEMIERLKIRPKERIIIEVSKQENVLKELFGAVKFKKKTARQMIEDFRKDAESKWLR